MNRLIFSLVLIPFFLGGCNRGSQESSHSLVAGELTVELTVATDRLEKKFNQRFDRSAQVRAITWEGETMLGVSGLPDEFGLNGLGILGFDEAKAPKGQFLKIGFGRLIRDAADPYVFWRAWPVAERSKTRLLSQAATSLTVSSSQSLGQWGYSLTKTYTVSSTPTATLEIQYELKNTGKAEFSFDHYNHNFFVAPQGGDSSLLIVNTKPELPFTPKENWRRLAMGWRLAPERPEGTGGYFELGLIPPQDFNFILSNEGGSARVIIQPNFKPFHAAVWADSATVCPEVFYRATLTSGETTKWGVSYLFPRARR
ncbi:MAG: hypothetical protein SH807_03880 [Blastochloris sp.]|nr:hypothetical protein [Blastochloris sp.]